MLEDPSGHALDHFHAALRRVERGEGKARVLFYGASHTAADHLPGHVRKGLQERFGDGGRGLTMPAPPSPLFDYWQWGATIEDGEGWTRVRLGLDRGVPDYYGIAGIYFDSEGRPAVARVSNAESGVGSLADVLEVLYQGFPGGGDFVVSIDGEERARVETDAPEVVAGRAVYEVEEGQHTMELRAVAGDPVRIYGFVFERSGPGVVVDDVALTGSRARYHAKWLEPIYSQHLRMRAPDLLVLWYGGNEGNDLPYPADVTSREIRLAVDKLLAAAPDASCVLLGAADKPLERDGEWIHRERTDAINRAIRTIAFAHGCAFFDTVSFMGGPLSMVRWVEADPTLARDDYIHFSALGYRLLSENLLYELLVDYVPVSARGDAGAASHDGPPP
jgi:lysophospholipase L1-like esterase